MAIEVQTLASGPGWCVRDVVCTAGPHDRPFEERHGSVCVAAVTQGTFRYRSAQGAALLAPGAVLLGNHGHCFECGHEHGIGDRCVSVHFAPEQWDDIVAAVPGARTATFALPRLPPLPALEPLIAALAAHVPAKCPPVRRQEHAPNDDSRARSDSAGTERALAASHDGDAAELEELALAFAGAVVATQRGPGGARRAASAHVERRISDAVRRIEHDAHDAAARCSLAALAREAAMSPYHFLRVFRRAVGMTPHQYVLRVRMHRAAVRLRRSDEPVSTIAFDAGFNDLSTFNRRFRRIMGASPTAFRTQRRLQHDPEKWIPVFGKDHAQT